MVKRRRRHTAACKFRIALEALEGSKTTGQLSTGHEVHANLIRALKPYPLADESVLVEKDPAAAALVASVFGDAKISFCP